VAILAQGTRDWPASWAPVLSSEAGLRESEAYQIPAGRAEKSDLVRCVFHKTAALPRVMNRADRGPVEACLDYFLEERNDRGDRRLLAVINDHSSTGVLALSTIGSGLDNEIFTFTEETKEARPAAEDPSEGMRAALPPAQKPATSPNSPRKCTRRSIGPIRGTAENLMAHNLQACVFRKRQQETSPADGGGAAFSASPRGDLGAGGWWGESQSDATQ